MNWFVEGLQGSGKSTLSRKIAEKEPAYTLIQEGDYSPVELAWCAYLNEEQYQKTLAKYPELREQIKEKTYDEGEKKIVCYTKIRTENHEFYRDLEQYEIYNNRVSRDDFQDIVLRRYRNWKQDGMIFECSLFQNTVEDMILFRDMSDDAILEFYKEVRSALEGKEYEIWYIESPDIGKNLGAVRRERVDKDGNEIWFNMVMEYFTGSPYAKKRSLNRCEDFLEHLRHRQALELRICRELFSEKLTVIRSKAYSL